MFWMKMKWIAIVVIALGAVGTSTGVWTLHRGIAHEAPLVKEANELPVAQRKPAEAKPVVPDDPLKEATDRAIVRRRLKELGLAMHNYHDTYRHLPPAAITDSTGRPLLSWRVALLPFLDQADLYKQFRLNEAWDSPHNKKLLDKMPRVFASIEAKGRNPSSTYYQLFVGPGAIYSSHRPFAAAGAPGFMGGPPGMSGGGGGPGGFAGGGEGMGGTGGAGMGPPGAMGGMGMAGSPLAAPTLSTISDGTSSTILIAEAGEAVPWTKPDDIPFDHRRPLPRLGGQFPNIFHVLMADGSVRSLPRTLDSATLRAAITAHGGEVVAWQNIEKTLVSPVRQQMLDRLREKNAQLKEEATIHGEILREMRAELDNLRWEIEKEKLITLDPTAAALQRENEVLEQTLKQSRDQVRKMMEELKQLREQLKTRSEK